MQPLLKEAKAIAHITGGGIPGNLPRVLPENVSAELDRRAWPTLPIFTLLQELGQISDEEMFRVFNMGIGLIFVTDPSFDPRPSRLSALEIGRVVPRQAQRIIIEAR